MFQLPLDAGYVFSLPDQQRALDVDVTVYLKTHLFLQTRGDGLQTQVVTRGFANHRQEFANPKRLRNNMAGQTNKPTITD